MKILFALLSLFVTGLASCNLTSKAKDKEPMGGIIPPMSVLPFWDVQLVQARSIAFRQIKKGKGTGAYRQFIALIIDQDQDKLQAVNELGFTKKDKRTWEDTYYGILLKSNEKDAQTLIAQYYIQGFPVTIKESKSIDGTETFSQIWYGSMPQVSGTNTVDARPIVQKIYQRYQSGDRDKRLLLQLRDHIEFLELNPQFADDLSTQITNDYLNQFSKNEISTYAGYRIVKKEAKDVRFDLIQELLNDRDYYNNTFVNIAKEKGLKQSNWHDADWIIGQAILKSFQKAADHNDRSLFEKAMAIKEQFEKEHMTVAVAKAILEFQIKQDNYESVKNAAVQYFSLNKNWYSAKEELLEAGANAVNKVSEKTKEWEQAESWIARVVRKRPNPTKYKLHADLLTKLGRNAEAKATRNKFRAFKEGFKDFSDFYPTVSRPITLQQEDVTPAEYKRVQSIPPVHKEYYRYIARESSIYKKGEAIEPIALLSKTDKEVVFLTRVHLVTGSILPVTHYRSYYIQSKFSIDGEHLESVYVRGATI